MDNHDIIEAEVPLEQLKLFSSVYVANYHLPPGERVWTCVQAKWDTGASVCFITRNLANRLGLQPESSMPVSSFSGNDECLYDVVALSFAFNGKFVVLLACIVDDFPHSDCDMLIGMNLITQGEFNLSTDLESKRIKIVFKPYPNVLRENY